MIEPMRFLYRARWETDIEAESEIEAARIAMNQQRDNDPDRIDNMFDVAEITENGAQNFVSVDIDTIERFGWLNYRGLLTGDVN